MSIGSRQLRGALGLARRDACEARERAGGVLLWLRSAARSVVCAATGRHRWSEWERSSSPFAPPERRRCRRCHGSQFRGSVPGVGMRPQFSWIEDQHAGITEEEFSDILRKTFPR